jgi:hypothetical protein
MRKWGDEGPPDGGGGGRREEWTIWPAFLKSKNALDRLIARKLALAQEVPYQCITFSAILG